MAHNLGNVASTTLKQCLTPPADEVRYPLGLCGSKVRLDVVIYDPTHAEMDENPQLFAYKSSALKIASPELYTVINFVFNFCQCALGSLEYHEENS